MALNSFRVTLFCDRLTHVSRAPSVVDEHGMTMLLARGVLHSLREHVGERIERAHVGSHCVHPDTRSACKYQRPGFFHPLDAAREKDDVACNPCETKVRCMCRPRYPACKRVPDLCHCCANWMAISRPSPLLPPVMIQNVCVSKSAAIFSRTVCSHLKMWKLGIPPKKFEIDLLSHSNDCAIHKAHGVQ